MLHPALPSFPDTNCGSATSRRERIFSFVLRAEPEDGKAKAHAFLDALSLFGLGYSWGGFESLAVHVNLSDRKVAKAPSEGRSSGCRSASRMYRTSAGISRRASPPQTPSERSDREANRPPSSRSN